MKSYYNEWEHNPAEWMRNLMAAGEIPPGLFSTGRFQKYAAVSGMREWRLLLRSGRGLICAQP